MQEMLILGAVILAVWILIIYLRVPAFAAFFSLLVGQLLSAEASTGAYDFVGGVIGVEMKYVQLGLLLLPLVLTILFLKGRRAKSKLAIDLLPALFVSVVAAILAYPLIPNAENIVQEATKGQVERYTTVLLIAAAVSGLLSAWTSFPKLHDKHSKKH